MPHRSELAPVLATPFLVRVETNDRFHLRYEADGRSLDDGRCGIDNNWVRSALSTLEAVDPDRLCRYCFPANGD
jgi:hypothetical protein